MPSQSLQRWSTAQLAQLSQFEAAPRAARLAYPAARQQLTDACVLLLAGHFQLFCRSLHSEAATFLAGQIPIPRLSTLVEQSLKNGRRLQRGNAQPDVLDGDFMRFGLSLRTALLAADSRNRDRLLRLQQLNARRNAIAHQDFTAGPGQVTTASRTGSTVNDVHRWRANCSILAQEIDSVVGKALLSVTGGKPW
jgi:hypothetical protein